MKIHETQFFDFNDYVSEQIINLQPDNLSEWSSFETKFCVKKSQTEFALSSQTFFCFQ